MASGIGGRVCGGAGQTCPLSAFSESGGGDRGSRLQEIELVQRGVKQNFGRLKPRLLSPRWTSRQVHVSLPTACYSRRGSDSVPLQWVALARRTSGLCLRVNSWPRKGG